MTVLCRLRPTTPPLDQASPKSTLRLWPGVLALTYHERQLNRVPASGESPLSMPRHRGEWPWLGRPIICPKGQADLVGQARGIRLRFPPWKP